MKKILLTIAVLSFFTGFAQTANDHIRNGNELYRSGQYVQAADAYSRALHLEPGNSVARNNYASALYKAGQQVEAAQHFGELAASARTRQMQARSYYNRGVILSAQKNIEESIEAYKNALRRDPNDVQARENLQKALLELKKKSPQSGSQDNEQQNKSQQNQSKLNQRETDQRLKLLAQKEKEVQERMQKEKSRAGGGTGKDW